MSRVRDTVLVVRPGALGDALLAIPALRALRRRFPSQRLVVATNPSIAELLLANRLADEVIPQDDTRLLWLFGARSRDDEGAEIEAAVLWSDDSDGTMRQSLERVGVRRVIHAGSRPAEGERRHVSDFLLASLEPFKANDAQDVTAAVVPLQGALQCADDWIERRGLSQTPFVILHPGSGSPRKNWPAARFVETAALLGRAGPRVLVSFGPADEQTKARFEAAGVGTAWEAIGPIEVSKLAALLHRSAGYLGNDSGVTHLAAMCGAPTVALFGATDPAVWAPHGPRVRVLHRPDWVDLHVSDVAGALLQLLR